MTVSLMSAGDALKKRKKKKKQHKTPCRHSEEILYCGVITISKKKIDLDKPGGTFMFFLLKPSISLTYCFTVLPLLSPCHAEQVLFSEES